MVKNSVFLTELTELTKLQDRSEAGGRRCCGFWALQRASSMSPIISLVNLFRFFTSFVSFSVNRLSFSSFCFPSVDCGCMASLPGLGLIVFVKVGSGGGVVFWQNLQN
jgi:hypothetical protein